MASTRSSCTVTRMIGFEKRSKFVLCYLFLLVLTVQKTKHARKTAPPPPLKKQQTNNNFLKEYCMFFKKFTLVVPIWSSVKLYPFSVTLTPWGTNLWYNLKHTVCYVCIAYQLRGSKEKRLNIFFLIFKICIHEKRWQ